MNLLCQYFRYLSLKVLVVYCKITFNTLTCSLYSHRYSLYESSCTATYAVHVLSAIIGIGPGFIGGMKVAPINMLHVLSSSTIAR